MSNYNISIQDRTKAFAVRVIKACAYLEEVSHICRILSTQLLRSGTSIGANCSEAKSAQSTRDFLNKYQIALKEARETLYWLEILIESDLVDTERFTSLLAETEEIIKILVATTRKLKAKRDNQK